LSQNDEELFSHNFFPLSIPSKGIMKRSETEFSINPVSGGAIAAIKNSLKILSSGIGVRTDHKTVYIKEYNYEKACTA